MTLSCPEYTITLYRGETQRQGLAEMSVRIPAGAGFMEYFSRNAPKVPANRPANAALFPRETGDFVGKVDVMDYGRLSLLLLHFGFEKMPNYQSSTLEEMTVTVETTSHGIRKTVKEYGRIGPIELWAIEQAIDSVAQTMTWDPK
jgi:hypothetical protein